MAVMIAGVPVPDEFWPRWRGWFAPECQPFDLTGVDATTRDLLPRPSVDVSPEVRDTFYCYHRDFVQLRATEFDALPERVRATLARTRTHPGRPQGQPDPVRRRAREQTGGGSFVWWPDLLELAGDGPIIDFVAYGLHPSRHRELSAPAWRGAERRLPRARELAGTFCHGSGPNCFGTVLEAAGEEVDDPWVQQSTFDTWLRGAAVAVGRRIVDHEAGVVLVWRDASGLPVHAAVTLGAGYALTKPSQCWYGPRLVWTVREAISHARTPGARLERWRLGMMGA